MGSDIGAGIVWKNLSIQTIMLGHYYFGKSTESRLVKLPLPVTFYYSYCKIRPKRVIYSQQIEPLNYKENIIDQVIVQSNGHLLEISDSSNLINASKVFGTVKVRNIW